MRADALFSCWTAPSVAPSSAPHLQDDVSKSQVDVSKAQVVGREEERQTSRVSGLPPPVRREDQFQYEFKGRVSAPSQSAPSDCPLYARQLIHTTDDRSWFENGVTPKLKGEGFYHGISRPPKLALMSLKSSGTSDPSSLADISNGSGVGVLKRGSVSGLPIDESAKKRWELHEHLPTFAKEMIAGGVAGAVAKTAVAPLERVKILFQTNLGDFHRAGVGGSLKRIWHTEGPLGFLKGNGATVLRVVPYAAVHFMTYEQYRRWLVQTTGHSSPPIDLIAGSLSGATAVFFTYPLDLIRTRLAWHVSGPSNAVPAAKGVASVDNIRGVFLEIVRKEGGLRGLYKGIGPTLYGILPYAGLKFYIYEMMKLAIYRATDEQPSLITKLGCGGVAGAIGQTLTYPLDVVRRQMQVQGAPADVAPRGIANFVPAQPYKSTWDGLRTIVRKQGWRQLYAGLSINYIKMVPSVAIGFTVYDGMKAWLRVPPREKGTRTAVTVS